MQKGGIFLQTGRVHVAERVHKYKQRMIEIRRDFHMHPELGNEEFRTSKVVSGILESLGLKVERGVAGTGVTALLEGGGSGKTVALRADMDALPIQDRKKVEYTSRVKGKMHACGHDAHTAILLGAAMVMTELKEHINGKVKFIFQPAEETTGGAARMVEEGVLDNPKVDAVFGLHVSPELEVGTVGIRCGIANACSDDFRIEVIGKSAHGAQPNEGVDAIAVSAQIINALQQVISRQIDPMEPGVMTVGIIRGGSQANIIADRVEMTGTIRTLDSATRQRIHEGIEDIAMNICRAMGAKHRVLFDAGYPLLINDNSMAEMVKKAAVKIVGDKVIDIQKPRLGVEDFAYYLQRVPGVFWRLGSGSREGKTQYVAHSPYFDIEEDALCIGAAVHVQTVLEYLQ